MPNARTITQVEAEAEKQDPEIGESFCAASAHSELTIKCLQHLSLKPCQPSTWEVKAKGCGIWGQLLLHSEFKASFD